MTASELTSMTVAELKDLAKKKKIALAVSAKKTDIIKAISKALTAIKVKAKTATTVKRQKPAAKKTEPAQKKRPPKRKAPEAEAPVVSKTPSRGWQMPAGVEEPLMAQERVSDAKYFTGAHEKTPLPYEYLPQEYGRERIALMTRDPYMVYGYWELPQTRLEREKAWFGWDSKLCVRMYDVTGVQFDGKNATSYFDQEVYERIGNWYFDLGRPTHSFCAELGLLAPDGRFLAIARSNTVTMPRDGVSDVIDEEWMLVEDEFMKLYGIPGSATGGLSSPQLQELMRQRRMLEITSPGLFSSRKVAKGK